MFSFLIINNNDGNNFIARMFSAECSILSFSALNFSVLKLLNVYIYDAYSLHGGYVLICIMCNFIKTYWGEQFFLHVASCNG